MLTKLNRYGSRAIEAPIITFNSLTNRPLSTYDSNQIKAPIKHVLFTCTQHKELHEDYKTLDQAMQSRAFTQFSQHHKQFGNVNIIPVEATHQFTINCNKRNIGSQQNEK